MDRTEKIPLVDLKAQYNSIKNEIDTAVEKCLSETDFIRGKTVFDFENAFSRYIGTNYCVGCGNGTDALELILKGLGIGPGDEVLVPALTWIATAEAVNNVGAEPVFVDVKSSDYTIDPDQIERNISENTRAIIPVHLYGCPCDMDLISGLAKNHKLQIIEDCAQAHGAEYKGKKVGTFGIASAFSFFPSKNLGAFGDGGAVVTNDQELADKARMLANHGQLHERHNHLVVGRNSRLDTIQAAILNVKLPYLELWNTNRIKAADHYKTEFGKTTSLKFSEYDNNKKHVFHLFVVRSPERNRLIEQLSAKGISTSVHYPKPLPFLEAYSYKRHTLNDFPIASKITEEVLSLPNFPEITLSQLDKICKAVIEYCTLL